MNSKEKKNMVLREVVKPELKRAGYRATGQTYKSMRDDCCLAIRINGSHFNSIVMGYTFWFEIEAFKRDLPEEYLKCWQGGIDSMREDPLLPDCGYLHPYHQPLGYKIDGYQDYKPQDMDVEDIKNRIGNDLRQYILPQLDEIKNYKDWERKKQDWNKRYYSKRICLLRYYHMAHGLAVVESNIPNLIHNRQWIGISAQEIKENYQLYQQIKALSPWPNEDKWAFILAALIAEETSG